MKSNCSANVVLAENFGGPDVVGNVIADDAASKPSLVGERLLDPRFEWKQGWQEDTCFSFGLDYSSLYLQSSEDGLTGDGYPSSSGFGLSQFAELLSYMTR
ncbi:MAG: hypothetical protein DRR06_08230 [Gammaproteobacteria bacterium]|nr:MAG: hypothetical protein DRR06_08230 [Gammaproteobacteria bacterium]RLA50852.1 MAG: hypothetical protein DRR42_11930 [Gammaproteobacteria bacterium]